MNEIRLTRQVRHALRLAREEARRLHRDQIGLELLLAGLVSAEHDTGGHVFQELSLDTHRIRQLAESAPQRGQSSRPSPHLSSEAKRILDAAIKQSHQRGHDLVGIEAVLLAVANDSNGLELLARLGASPERIRRQMQRRLQESRMASEADHLRPEEFIGSRGHVDINRLLSNCVYPLYILLDKSRTFHLCKTEFGIANEMYLQRVSFEFSRPVCFAKSRDARLVQRARIDNWGRTGLGNTHLWQTMANIDALIISEGMLKPPVEFVGLLGGSIDEKSVVRWQDLPNGILWEPYRASGLNFNIAHWNRAQVPVGWAYSVEEEPQVVIATLGVPRPDFEKIVESLIVLQQENEDLIARFHEEMASAGDEFDE